MVVIRLLKILSRDNVNNSPPILSMIKKEDITVDWKFCACVCTYHTTKTLLKMSGNKLERKISVP
jgi:hypothetical protein